LQTGDRVRIPPVRLGEPEERPFHPSPGLAERLREAVLYEDREILVLNKPSGLAVHKGSGLDYGVIEALRALRPDEPFLELAHRLDRETSGCLALARTPGALRQIQAALRAGQVEKRYLALVRGYWNHGPREVNQPLRRNVLRGGERMVEVLEDGPLGHGCNHRGGASRLVALFGARCQWGRSGALGCSLRALVVSQVVSPRCSTSRRSRTRRRRSRRRDRRRPSHRRAHRPRRCPSLRRWPSRPWTRG